ncbi:hypothetical protein IJT93_06795 [bacterium]|nr:hypothetical protein [bacterium]
MKLGQKLLISFTVSCAAFSLLGGCCSDKGAENLKSENAELKKKEAALQEENARLKEENASLKDEKAAAEVSDFYGDCKSNLRNIGIACEMYATDNRGAYPRSLQQLQPEYLKLLPQCPSAEADTYSDSYEFSSEPDVFTVYCKGSSHASHAENYPQYTSLLGIIEDK